MSSDFVCLSLYLVLRFKIICFLLELYPPEFTEYLHLKFTFAEPKIGLLPNKYNFRYYGTKNAELASKERTNTRSGDGNKGESKPLPTLGYGKNVARESKSFSSRSNSEGRKIRTSYGDIVPKVH